MDEQITKNYALRLTDETQKCSKGSLINLVNFKLESLLHFRLSSLIEYDEQKSGVSFRGQREFISFSIGSFRSFPKCEKELVLLRNLCTT